MQFKERLHGAAVLVLGLGWSSLGPVPLELGSSPLEIVGPPRTDGVDWAGFERNGFESIGFESTGFERGGFDWIRFDWIRFDWIRFATGRAYASELSGRELEASVDAAENLLASRRDKGWAELAREALDRNPAIARGERLAAAAESRAPQVRALPDPVASLALFVLPPETRSGPQRLEVSLRQKLPWFGKLALREQAALFAAAAARAEVEILRLDTLTDIRVQASELAFLDSYEAIVRAERSALVRYEKAAQARYAAGTGLQQGIVRIQAQITRADTRLLEIAERRSVLVAELNRLRDRPAMAAIPALDRNEPPKPDFDAERLQELARRHRPELAVAEARIAAAASLVSLAEKNFRPDLSLGFSYTVVDRRDDRLARLESPDDDGDDVLALSASLDLPVWRRKLAAGVEEAQAKKWAEEEGKRVTVGEIERAVGDLTTRMPLLFEHLSLLENVLLKQAKEALRSAETAYSTGKLNAVDLLDAEVVLFEVQIATAQVRSDLMTAWARLDRAVARPVALEALPSLSPRSSPELSEAPADDGMALEKGAVRHGN